MYFSDNESDNESTCSVNTPTNIIESKNIINFDNINKFIDSIINNYNNLDSNSCVSIISIKKTDNYKIIMMMINIKSKINYKNFIVYDDTNISYSLHDDKMNLLESTLSEIAIEVCKKYNI
jgi:hypothetical protein